MTTVTKHCSLTAHVHMSTLAPRASVQASSGLKLTCVPAAPTVFCRQMCEILVTGLPLKCDAVESHKVNDLLVRMAEVRRLCDRAAMGTDGTCDTSCRIQQGMRWNHVH